MVGGGGVDVTILFKSIRYILVTWSVGVGRSNEQSLLIFLVFSPVNQE